MDIDQTQQETTRDSQVRRDMAAANYRSQGRSEEWITAKLATLFPTVEPVATSPEEVEGPVAATSAPRMPLPAQSVDQTERGEARKQRRAGRRAVNHVEHPVWYRRGLTAKDVEFLDFLTAFTYAKARHLALIHGTTEKNAYRRLKGLAEYGYVTERRLHDTAAVWFPTAKGVKQSTHAGVLRAKPVSRASWAAMPHNFVVAYLAAAAQGGRLNVFNSDQFTAIQPTIKPSEQVKHVEAENGPLSDADRAELIRQVQRFNHKITAANVARRKQNAWQVISEHLITSGFKQHGPDRVRGFGWLKVQTPTSVVRVNGAAPAKVPDLVLLHERPNGPFGDVLKIAVEVELNFKGNRKTKPLLMAYGHSDYDQVIYVVPDQQDRDNLTHLLADPTLERARNKITVQPLMITGPTAPDGSLVPFASDTSVLYRL